MKILSLSNRNVSIPLVRRIPKNIFSALIVVILSTALVTTVALVKNVQDNRSRAQTPGQGGAINVVTKGAKNGDTSPAGVQATTEAFKKAVNESLQTRAPIYVPAGSYYINDTIVLGVPQNDKENVVEGDKTVDMYGDGMGASRILYFNPNSPTTDLPSLRVRRSEQEVVSEIGGIIQIGNGTYNVGGRIHDLTIDGMFQRTVNGVKQEGGGSGVVVFGRSSAQIDNIAVVNTKGKGIAMYGNTYRRIDGNRWSTAYAGAFVNTVQFLASGHENIYMDYRSVAARIIGNDMQGAGVRDGFRKDIKYSNIHVHSSSDVEIVGNNITEPGGSGIQLSSAVEVVISGNYIHGLGDNAIRADVGGNHAITGNVISYFAERGYPDSVLASLPFDAPKGSEYLQSSAWGGSAILLRDTTATTVTGNTILTDGRPKGQAHEYRPKAAIIEDRRITGQRFQTDYNVITGNTIQGDFQGPAILKVGANTIVDNNAIRPQFIEGAISTPTSSPIPTSSPTPTLTPMPTQIPVTMSPASGSVIGGKTIFSWSGLPAGTQSWLTMGSTPGANNIFGSSPSTNSTIFVSNVPPGGQTVYVRLFWTINGVQSQKDFTYTSQ